MRLGDSQRWYDQATGLEIGSLPPTEYWLVYDHKTGVGHYYVEHEVEHVTCESDAEQTTLDGSVSG